MPYIRNKGIGRVQDRGRKPEDVKYLTVDEFKSIIASISRASDSASTEREIKRFRRDHAMIVCGFNLALRVGEVVRLKKDHFKNISRGIVEVPTEKRRVTVRMNCGGCGHVVRSNIRRVKTKKACENCGRQNEFPARTKDNAMPVHQVRVLSNGFRDYIASYIESLPDRQEWLFVGQGRGKPLSIGHTEHMFQTWVVDSGIRDAVYYSWHSLRHGMATKIAEFGGENMTVTALTIRDTLRHTSLRSAETYLHLQETNEIADRISAELGDLDIT